MKYYFKLLELQGFDSQIDQYKIGKYPLHIGKFCTVMKGKHKVTEEFVAIKIIKKSTLEKSALEKYKDEAYYLYQC